MGFLPVNPSVPFAHRTRRAIPDQPHLEAENRSQPAAPRPCARLNVLREQQKEKKIASINSRHHPGGTGVLYRALVQLYICRLSLSSESSKVLTRSSGPYRPQSESSRGATLSCSSDPNSGSTMRTGSSCALTSLLLAWIRGRRCLQAHSR